MLAMLYLMMGLPGAGKTTIARLIEEQTGATRLTSDEIRLQLWPEPTFTEAEHQELYDYIDNQTEELLSAGKSVVYDANLNRLVHRQQKYAIAQKTGAAVKLLVVRTPTELAHQRSVVEADGQPNRVFGNLDEAVFDRLKNEIEWPTADEPFVEIRGVEVNADDIHQILEA